jgi:hypothetical protein
MILIYVVDFSDIDECKEKTACQCPECSCTNNWGSFDCQCQGGLLYMREHDACIGKYNIMIKNVGVVLTTFNCTTINWISKSKKTNFGCKTITPKCTKLNCLTLIKETYIAKASVTDTLLQKLLQTTNTTHDSSYG